MRVSPKLLGCLLVGCVAVGGAAALATDGPAATQDEITPRGVHWVVDALKQKERSLSQREATLTAREADLRLAEKKIEQSLAELDALRSEIRAQIEQMDQQRLERVVGVVRMLEGMRPKDAAAIMSVTETDVAIQVLDRMSRTKAGKILAEMNPEQAAALTTTYATTPDLGAP